MLSILRQIGEALREALDRSIPHQDLRPERVWIDPTPATPVAKAFGFGLPRITGTNGKMDLEPGSLHRWLWTAPELLGGGHHGFASADVWAVGLIAFWMIAGSPYWKGTDPGSLMGQVMFEPLPPASERIAELACGRRPPQGFDAWLLRCLDRDPMARFPDAPAAVAALLDLYAATIDGEPPPQGDHQAS